MSVEVQAKPQVAATGEEHVPSVISGGNQLTLMEIWRVLMKQRFVVLAITILSFGGALWYVTHTPPIYESVGRIEIKPQGNANIGLEQMVQQARQSGDDLQTEVRILQSDTVLFDTAQSLNLLDRFRNGGRQVPSQPKPAAEVSPTERRAMIAYIRAGLAVNVITGTDIVEIHYQSTNPALAAAIVNRMVETYSDEDLRTKYDRTIQVSDWLQKQLAGLKSEASDAQQALANYQKQHNIVGTDENSNLTIQTLQDLSSSVDTAEADRIMKEARLRDFNALSPNLVALMGDNPDIETLRTQLADLQTQKAQLALKYGPRYPPMVTLQAQINKVQGQINAEVALARRQVAKEYQSAAGAERALRNRLGAQEEAAYKLNEGAAQYAILRNQAELTRDLYDALQMRLKEATVTAGLSAANITVVDKAQLPILPVAPRKRFVVLSGLLGGLLGGCVLAFLIESIDDRLQTSDEVERVSMLPSLAAIPHFASNVDTRKTEKGAGQAGVSMQLVTLRDSKSTGAEAYRSLRSSLLLSSIDNPPRLIVLTSAFPAEGKTTTAANCAIVLAQRGERVLLVDADLRRGRLGALLGLSRTAVGLSTILSNPDTIQEIQAPIAELPNLHVLPTGPRPPNPAEMLSSARLQEQLHQWLQEYDRIVLDTAPLLSVSDTQPLAVFADTVVLVTRARTTRKRALIRARDLLLRVSAPIAGVVVNDVNVRLENFYTHRYGMYGYGYSYGSYSDRAYGYENEDEETH